MLFGTGIRGGAQTTVRIGGVDAPVIFAGPHGAIDLDQINVRVPRTLIGRGPVEVAVTTDGKAANIVRISFR